MSLYTDITSTQIPQSGESVTSNGDMPVPEYIILRRWIPFVSYFNLQSSIDTSVKPYTPQSSFIGQAQQKPLLDLGLVLGT
jgi:hypothetical protein